MKIQMDFANISVTYLEQEFSRTRDDGSASVLFEIIWWEYSQEMLRRPKDTTGDS